MVADLSLKGMQDKVEKGLSEGVSAADMSRELRGYLKNPDKLFCRVRDERGNLTLSRNARLFHPGQGVYRSSYMNARRLAATETNMAYRSADHERWKSLDFVVGIEIQTSNNHTTKDSRGKTVELEDICDTLAGRYPKGFKFVGWHPHCRCIATTILKTEEEMEADTERMLNGEEPLPPKDSKNYIGNTPDDFNNWAVHNLKRIETARQNGTLPYFLKDNEKYITVQRLGNALLATAKGFADVDWAELEKAVRKGDIAETRKQIDAVSLKVDEARAEGEKKLADIIKVAAEVDKVKQQEVEKLNRSLTEAEIIYKVSGGDETTGSCASVALAYVGNKCGYDVLDYRGGGSRSFFARNIDNIIERLGGHVAKDYNAVTAAGELLTKMQTGREYILSAGGHSSVIRRLGEKKFEFLELQSPISNGFKPLTTERLQNRFKCTKSHTIVYVGKVEQSCFLLDVDILRNNKEFRKLLGYLNTAKDNQKKGDKGSIK